MRALKHVLEPVSVIVSANGIQKTGHEALILVALHRGTVVEPDLPASRGKDRRLEDVGQPVTVKIPEVELVGLTFAAYEPPGPRACG